jgi:hypothetical protein
MAKKKPIEYKDVYDVTLPGGVKEQLADGSKWKVGSFLYNMEDKSKTPLWVITAINHKTKIVKAESFKK